MWNEKLETNKINLSTNIKRLRKLNQLAQERLGLEAGVDRTVVSKIERNVSNPSLEVLVKIATRLGVEVADLLMRDDKHLKNK